MSHEERIWREFARGDLDTLAQPVSGPIRFRARNTPGRLLLPLIRSRLYTYAHEDVPKHEWVRNALRNTGQCLLDVGVRTGTAAREFTLLGKTVYGIDLVAEYVEHCRHSSVIAYGAVCDVTTGEVPVPATFSSELPDKYDVIFAGEILEHLLDAKDVLIRLGKVCRTGGCLILTTPNLAYLGNRIRVLFGTTLHPLTTDRGVVGNQHIRLYTAHLLKRLLADAGFETVSVGSDGVVVNVSRFIRADVEGAADNDTNPSGAPLLVFPFSNWPFPTFGRTLYMKAIRLEDT